MKNGRLMFLYHCMLKTTTETLLLDKDKKKMVNMVVFVLGNDEQVVVSTKTHAWWRSGRWLNLLVEKELFIM